MLVYFLLPALLDGRSPVAMALVAGAAILLVVLYVAHGFSMRTTTALLGTLMALTFTAGFAAIATSAARLTGRSNEIYADLEGAGVKISISGLILCGLIIGALGVINDITVTQASSVWELSAAEPHASWRTLFTSGMRIGRDHISSVIYTLVFAYTGAALPVLLLFSISGRSLHDLVTGDEIAGEIVRDLVGGVGLMLAVPFTTLIAAIVAARPHADAEAAPVATDATVPPTIVARGARSTRTPDSMTSTPASHDQACDPNPRPTPATTPRPGVIAEAGISARSNVLGPCSDRDRRHVPAYRGGSGHQRHGETPAIKGGISPRKRVASSNVTAR